MQSSSIFNKFNILLGIFFLTLAGLVIYLNAEFNSPERTKQYLQSNGYTSIHIGNYNYWCARGTPIRRHFKAINSKGQEVDGSICSGNWIYPDEIKVEFIVRANPKPKM
jgi:hypothetical protein